jgi:hypothetical protein
MTNDRGFLLPLTTNQFVQFVAWLVEISQGRDLEKGRVFSNLAEKRL